MTGTYVAKAERELMMVDVVESKNGALAGRFEVLSIKHDGTLSDTTAGLTGVRDKDAISLTADSNYLFTTARPLSASINGPSLFLTFPGAAALTLNRTTMASYRADVSALRESAAAVESQVAAQKQQIAAQQTAENERQAEEQRVRAEQAELSDLMTRSTADMNAFTARADRIAVKAVKISSAYDRVTQGMTELLDRQRLLSGQERFSDQRDRIGVALADRARATDQTHDDVETGSRDIANIIERIDTETRLALERCQSPGARASASLSAACQGLPTQASLHRSRAAKALGTLAELEQRYQIIAARQKGILNASVALQ